MKLKNLLTDIITEGSKNIPNSLDGTFYLEYFLTNTENGLTYNVEIKRPGEKVGQDFTYESVKKDTGDVSKMIMNGFKIASKLGLIYEKDSKSDLVVTDGKIQSINGVKVDNISIKQTLDSNEINNLKNKLLPQMGEKNEAK
jgi:hypothetical protein